MSVLSGPISRRTVFFTLGAAACAAGSTESRAQAGSAEGGTTYSVVHSLAVKEIPKGAKQVRIWFWIPQDDESQKVLDMTVRNAPGKYSIQRDPTYGSRYLYCEVTEPAAEEVALATEFLAQRQEIKTTLDPAKAGSVAQIQPELFAEQLRQDVPNMEVDERIRALAEKICGQETGVIQQARLIYDYVIDHAEHYSKGPNAPKSSQLGSASYCITNGGGACTDLHALFIALARARKIPTRLSFGSRLQPQNDGKENDPGYRCWVHFFAPNHGWVPCDLAAGDTQAGKRDFYFGNLDDRRLQFNEGRDLQLSPAQAGPRVNVVIVAYVEVDGKPHSRFERKLKFTEVKQ